MVSGDCAFPVNFESSGKKRGHGGIRCVILLMTKRNSNIGAPKRILRALQITQITMPG